MSTSVTARETTPAKPSRARVPERRSGGYTNPHERFPEQLEPYDPLITPLAKRKFLLKMAVILVGIVLAVAFVYFFGATSFVDTHPQVQSWDGE